LVPSDLHPFLHVAQRDVAHFVADHRFNFVIVHHVHQPAVDADAAVSHGEGVDVFGFIHLVVHRLAVDVIAQRGGDFAQTLAVFAAGRGDVALLSISLQAWSLKLLTCASLRE
jgi:hypothetical protein